MQATINLRRSSFATVAILSAIVLALILGALAGYWLKGLAPRVTAPATAVSVGSAAAVTKFAVPAGQAARSVQRHPAPGALKAAGDDSASIAGSSASVSSSSSRPTHRRGVGDSDY